MLMLVKPGERVILLEPVVIICSQNKLDQSDGRLQVPVDIETLNLTVELANHPFDRLTAMDQMNQDLFVLIPQIDETTETIVEHLLKCSEIMAIQLAGKFVDPIPLSLKNLAEQAAVFQRIIDGFEK